jgi:transposase
MLTPDWKNTTLYIRPGITDMRKQIGGLSVVVQEELERDPFASALFLFCNRQRRILKALWWDRNGFCMWQKRLEKDRFPWPKGEGEAQQISNAELKMLLSGIDFWKAHKAFDYQTV